MKKKILVVGGAGYVGGVIVDLLLSRKNYDVTVFDNLLYEDSYRKNCKFISAPVAASCDCFIGFPSKSVTSTNPFSKTRLNEKAFSNCSYLKIVWSEFESFLSICARIRSFAVIIRV